MRTITIEIEGKHESAVIAQMMQAARTAARTAQDTYVFAGVDVPTRTEIDIPGFMKQGKKEKMGVVW